MRHRSALLADDAYSARSTDIGVIRTARSAGTSEPAIVIASATLTAAANAAGSPGATWLAGRPNAQMRCLYPEWSFRISFS